MCSSLFGTTTLLSLAIILPSFKVQCFRFVVLMSLFESSISVPCRFLEGLGIRAIQGGGYLDGKVGVRSVKGGWSWIEAKMRIREG